MSNPWSTDDKGITADNKAQADYEYLGNEVKKVLDRFLDDYDSTDDAYTIVVACITDLLTSLLAANTFPIEKNIDTILNRIRTGLREIGEGSCLCKTCSESMKPN